MLVLELLQIYQLEIHSKAWVNLGTDGDFAAGFGLKSRTSLKTR